MPKECHFVTPDKRYFECLILGKLDDGNTLIEIGANRYRNSSRVFSFHELKCYSYMILYSYVFHFFQKRYSVKETNNKKVFVHEMRDFYVRIRRHNIEQKSTMY